MGQRPSREAIEETVALLLDAQRTVTVAVPPGAKPGQKINVQVPDLKLRLDGLKFLSERVEWRPAEASASTENYPMPSTLGYWERLPFVQVEVRVYRRARTARHRAPDRGREPGRLGGAPQERRQRRSLRWVVHELDKMERRAALT